MPVLVTPLTSKMKLQFRTGVDGEGKPVYRSKTVSKVKTDAPDQDVLTPPMLWPECAPTPLPQ